MSAELEEQVEALAEWFFAWTTSIYLGSESYPRHLGPQVWCVRFGSAGGPQARFRLEVEWHERGWFLVGAASRVEEGDVRWHALGCSGVADDHELEARLPTALTGPDSPLPPLEIPLPHHLVDRARWHAELELTRARLAAFRDAPCPAIWRAAGVGWSVVQVVDRDAAGQVGGAIAGGLPGPGRAETWGPESVADDALVRALAELGDA